MRAGDIYSIFIVGPILVSLILALAVGCGVSGGMGAGSQSNSSVDNPMTNSNVSDPDDQPDPIIEPDNSNSNDNTSTDSDSFNDAIRISMSSGSAAINGAIADPGDVDVYDIGPVYAGEQVTFDVQAISGDLNANAALFDENENLLYANNDRAYYSGQLDPRIVVTARRDMDHCYAAISAYFSSGTSGSYEASISITDGSVPTANSGQVVYLNFNGDDSVSIGTQSAIAIPTFEESAIGLRFSDETDYIIDRITALVREDYLGMDVEIISSREEGKPAGEYTTIHFGSYNEQLLGLADNVDEYNMDYSQQAVVFVDTFEAFLSLNPSADEMAQAIANVASHEAGHLLGLQHSYDTNGIMDTSASLNRMMLQQAFTESNLDLYVFPIGDQDAPQLLVDAVGGDLETIRSNAMLQLSTIQHSQRKLDGPPARDTATFGTCLGHSCCRHKAHEHEQDE